MRIDSSGGWFLKTGECLIPYGNFFSTRDEAISKLKRIIEVSESFETYKNKIPEGEAFGFDKKTLKRSIKLVKIDKNLSKISHMFRKNVSMEKYLS